MNGWSDQEKEYLSRWWGVTPMAKIGETLGRTKNACVGMGHRLGLPNLGNPVKPSLLRPEQRNGIRRAQAERQRELARATPKPAPKIQPEPKPIIPEQPRLPWTGEPVSLAEVGRDQCRWPVGNNLACGAPTERRKSYCDHHRKLSRGKHPEAA